MSLLNIALTGLGVAQTALATTSNNITNANTEGYSRQRTEQGTLPSDYTGGGYIGNGAQIKEINRYYNEFINEELRLAGQGLRESESYLAQSERLDSLLASSSTNLTTSMERFFSSLSTAAEDPQSSAVRQLVLSEASSVADRHNVLYKEITNQNDYINNQITTVVDQINQHINAIAGLNDAIAKAISNGRQPNEVLDQRELALRDLSELVGVSTVEQSNGEINVFVGTGQALVVGTEVTELVVGPALDGGFQKSITQPPIITDLSELVSGGELGGLLSYQDELLLPALNEIGRMAVVMAEAINNQQLQGLDAEGNFGVPVFADYNSEANMRNRVFPNTDNTGDAVLQVEITDPGMLTAGDYTVRVNDGNYTVFSVADQVEVANGSLPLPVTISLPDHGIDIHLNSGAAQDKDAFFISPTRRSSEQIERVLSEPSQLAFAAPLRSTSSLDNRGDISITQPILTSNLDGNSQSLVAAGGGVPFDLVYDEAGGQWQVANLPAGYTLSPANATFNSGVNNSYSFTLSDGAGNSVELALDISGRAENGDSFTVEFNRDGVADNRNVLDMIAIQTDDLVRSSSGASGPNQSLVASYGQIVEEVGVITATKQIDSQAYKSIHEQAVNSREEVSGVNLDEEAANLIKFEQAYNASSQIISIARDLFDRILQL